MRANRGRDTGPEHVVRKALHAAGFRFRLHDGRLQGTPDIVLAKHRAVVFVHGCFWHGHRCRRKPQSRSRTAFWREKIRTNQKRDISVQNKLLHDGWRVLVIWECAVRRSKPPFADTEEFRLAAEWLRNGGSLAEISEAGFEERL